MSYIYIYIYIWNILANTFNRIVLELQTNVSNAILPAQVSPVRETTLNRPYVCIIPKYGGQQLDFCTAAILQLCPYLNRLDTQDTSSFQRFWAFRGTRACSRAYVVDYWQPLCVNNWVIIGSHLSKRRAHESNIQHIHVISRWITHAHMWHLCRVACWMVVFLSKVQK